MGLPKQDPGWTFGNDLWTTIAAVALALLMIVLATQLHAQTYNVIYNFTGGPDSGSDAGLTIDKAGNLNGTTCAGGASSQGSVFRLSRKGSSWVFNTLYSFSGGKDGARLLSGVVFGPDGSLYGTTELGDPDCVSGCGTIFNLKPPATACKTALCGWTETLPHSFTGSPDGANPGFGDLVFDQSGNLYGTTIYGGTSGCGTVFQLAHSGSGRIEKVLYSFQCGTSDGANPYAGLVFDNSGNLYGTTRNGGAYGYGTVFQLTPSGSGWAKSTLYSFQGDIDGASPFGGLVFDNSGNLYGTTSGRGAGGGGTVFELTPSNGSWTYTVLYSFSGCFGCGPYANLVTDAGGSLYGTTYKEGAYGFGSIFKLTPANGSWTYTALHDFAGGSDGAYLYGNAAFDANGDLYGTVYEGGANGNGLVWEITP
jgi:uncharacterized repeat protein (TIGR03803 family)